jgi:hypothetical protein
MPDAHISLSFLGRVQQALLQRNDELMQLPKHKAHASLDLHERIGGLARPGATASPSESDRAPCIWQRFLMECPTMSDPTMAKPDATMCLEAHVKVLQVRQAACHPGRKPNRPAAGRPVSMPLKQV